MATLIVLEDLAHPAVVGRGGSTMRKLHWLEGLRRLGHEVYFVEFLGEPPSPAGVRYFEQVIDNWWARERAALLIEPTLECASGLDAAAVSALAARADAVLTLCAPYRREPRPLVDSVRPRVLFDADPAYTNLWALEEADPADIYGEHDFYFTVGLNIGTPACAVPTLGIDWRPLPPPVVLDFWAADSPISRNRFTTIGVWRDYCGYLEFEDQILGPKAEEFYKFITLPRLVGEPLELAFGIDHEDPDVPRLREHGWMLEDPSIVFSPAQYISYVSGSAGEFSCANGGYVGTRSGWFSDRSASYLAAGRPVVLQATGSEDALPTGEGLFAVSTVEEAADAIRSIRADYTRHSQAARSLAREYLDSDVVLRRMLEHVGIRSELEHNRGGAVR